MKTPNNKAYEQGVKDGQRSTLGDMIAHDLTPKVSERAKIHAKGFEWGAANRPKPPRSDESDDSSSDSYSDSDSDFSGGGGGGGGGGGMALLVGVGAICIGISQCERWLSGFRTSPNDVAEIGRESQVPSQNIREYVGGNSRASRSNNAEVSTPESRFAQALALSNAEDTLPLPSAIPEERSAITAETLFEQAQALDKAMGNRRENEVASLVRQAAERGHVEAAGLLGGRYCEGMGVDKNVQEGIRWLQVASDRQDAFADGYLGHLYRYGRGVPKNEAKALQLSTRSAEHGNKESMLNVAGMLAQGIGTRPNHSESERWYKRAFDAYKEKADQGESRSQVFIGKMYRGGQGVTKDVSMAAHWFSKAASAGDRDGQFHMGELLYSGQDDGRYAVGKDRTGGLVLLQAAARAGHDEARNFLRKHAETW